MLLLSDPYGQYYKIGNVRAQTVEHSIIGLPPAVSHHDLMPYILRTTYKKLITCVFQQTGQGLDEQQRNFCLKYGAKETWPCKPRFPYFTL